MVLRYLIKGLSIRHLVFYQKEQKRSNQFIFCHIDISDAVGAIAALLAVDPLVVDGVARVGYLVLQSGLNAGDLPIGQRLCSGEDPCLVGPDEAEPGVAAVDQSISVVISIEHLVVTLGIVPELNMAVAFSIAAGTGSTIAGGDVGWVVGLGRLVVDVDRVDLVPSGLISVGGGDTILVVLVPEVLVPLDLVPVACVSFRLKISDRIWSEDRAPTDAPVGVDFTNGRGGSSKKSVSRQRHN